MSTRLPLIAVVCTLVCLVFACLTCAAIPCAPAGQGLTVYGVTNFVPGPALPTFINNNFTCAADIMAGPGGFFPVGTPDLNHNISQFGPVPTPYYSFRVGGGNGSGPFGAAQSLVTNSQVAFIMRDAIPGGNSGSYMIDSWQSTIVSPGFANQLGLYLSIASSLPALTSFSEVSLVSEVNVNGVWFQLTPMILAGSRTGLWGVGDVFELLTRGSGFVGLSRDTLAGLPIVPGTVLSFNTTLTVIADPADIDSILPDPQLVADIGLPEISLIDTGADGEQLPEPTSLGLLGSGLVAGAFYLKRMAKLS